MSYLSNSTEYYLHYYNKVFWHRKYIIIIVIFHPRLSRTLGETEDKGSNKAHESSWHEEIVKHIKRISFQA